MIADKKKRGAEKAEKEKENMEKEMGKEIQKIEKNASGKMNKAKDLIVKSILKKK